jgi:hypothetical protein
MHTKRAGAKNNTFAPNRSQSDNNCSMIVLLAPVQRPCFACFSIVLLLFFSSFSVGRHPGAHFITSRAARGTRPWTRLSATMAKQGVLALLCALALLAARLPVGEAQRVVPAGTVFLDTVNRWTLADSPVFLNGLLTIDRGATLTIDPGVVVNCTTTASGILVRNMLRIQGTVNLPVRCNGGLMRCSRGGAG